MGRAWERGALAARRIGENRHVSETPIYPEYGDLHVSARTLEANFVLSLRRGTSDRRRKSLLDSIVSETGARSIGIFNEVDDEQHPPLKRYTDVLWHGKAVSVPDSANLRHCTCSGACDPSSGGCACAILQGRHMAAAGMAVPNSDAFLYNADGLLISSGVPICRSCRR